MASAGSDLGVGADSGSNTTHIQTSNEFVLDGRRVGLIDTPGFDDATLNDTDVLEMIATFLTTMWVLSFASPPCLLSG